MAGIYSPRFFQRALIPVPKLSRVVPVVSELELVDVQRELLTAHLQLIARVLHVRR